MGHAGSVLKAMYKTIRQRVTFRAAPDVVYELLAGYPAGA